MSISDKINKKILSLQEVLEKDRTRLRDGDDSEDIQYMLEKDIYATEAVIINLNWVLENL